MNLDGVAGTAGDAAGLDSVVVGALVIGGKFGYDGLVPGHIGTYLPVPVPGLDSYCIDLELDTGVLKVTDVGVEVVGEVCTCSYRSPVEEVLGEALVEVDGTVDAVIEEAIVKTYVPGRGGLPLQVGVVAGRSDRLDYLVAENVLAGISVIDIGGQGRIVTCIEVLLTGLTVAQTELECGHCIAVAEERLVLDVPAQGN